MSQLQQQKCVEAAAQLKQAEKALTRRSFFRGSPDYLSAAPLLDKAGELFRLGNDWEASKDAFRRCADAQQHNRLPFRAAQAWENVAKTVLQQVQAEGSSRTVFSQKSRTGEARQAFEKASGFYVDMGEFGKAADALVKGAQACESQGSSVDDVLPLYTHACELLEAQDKPHFAVETFRKLQSFLVKYEKYRDAIALLDRLTALYEAMDQRHNVHKCRLSQVILHLASGDVPAADALYSKCLQDDAFLSSDDCALAEDLVRAYKMGNEDLLRATVRKPGFLALDNQIGRVSRKLSIYGPGDVAAGGVKPQARRQHGAAPSSSIKRTQEQQQSGKQRNPFAPSARAPPARRNPFAPLSRAPVPSLTSEYESSETPTTVSTGIADSDYEAALSEALSTVAVTKKTKTHSRSASVSKSLQPVSPEPVGPSLSFGLSPTMASSSSPAAVRASACMDYGCDDLEFAMPDSDSLEFFMDEPTGANVGGRSGSFRTDIAPASKTKAPAREPKPTPKAPVHDEFDLT
uniref:Gamma-soluble NSF attachment protein n=1 Tax=Hyaloperonospora arabidopsidis (strain Emoy2) TaxID=559515 RepID=M4C024_HYAAE